MFVRLTTPFAFLACCGSLLLLLVALPSSVDGFSTAPSLLPMRNRHPQAGNTAALSMATSQIDTSFMWNRGNAYGTGDFKFYQNFDAWMAVFPPEDQADYPEIFSLPAGVREVALTAPLGIVFEEIDKGRGLFVQDLVEDGNAARSGSIQVGDVLVAMTATKVVGAKFERRLIPARNFDFDTMVGAVESNAARWGCSDVVLLLERPSEIVCQAAVDDFLEFFEPPFGRLVFVRSSWILL
jgi:hypothetical protein